MLLRSTHASDEKGGGENESLPSLKKTFLRSLHFIRRLPVQVQRRRKSR
jgi:hypothetical protein